MKPKFPECEYPKGCEDKECSDCVEEFNEELRKKREKHYKENYHGKKS